MHSQHKIIIIVLLIFHMNSWCANNNNNNHLDMEKAYYNDPMLYSNNFGDLSSADGEEACGEKKCFGSNSVRPKSNSKHTASNIAIKAAQEAKAASDAQVPAAETAAQQVKLQLADKAMQSAKAAEAALAGKQQIVDQLDRELKESETAINEITSSLQTTESNSNLASQAYSEARNQLADMKNLVKAAVNNLRNIENVASGAQQELAEKTQLLEAAKNRIDCVRRQLNAAQQDLETTKKAAYKAVCAASEAHQKASRTKRMMRLRHAHFHATPYESD